MTSEEDKKLRLMLLSEKLKLMYEEVNEDTRDEIEVFHYMLNYILTHYDDKHLKAARSRINQELERRECRRKYPIETAFT